jgi:hypothetical protein
MRETTHFNCHLVFRAIRNSDGRARVWSSIAAEILGVDKRQVKIADVRGVRDCVRKLEAKGLVRESSHLRFVAA